MVDSVGEKVDECLLNRGRLVMLAYNWDRENCPIYGVAGCPLCRGCLSMERQSGLFIIVRYIVGVHYLGVSVKRGSTVSIVGFF